jgi:hypothetical protein
MSATQILDKLIENNAMINELMLQIQNEAWPPKRIEYAKRAAVVQCSQSALIDALSKFDLSKI